MLKGIEVYLGKPVIYSLNNYVPPPYPSIISRA
jgi:poly-gamma-glutamate capsule biosynthesis protein CapA/YwtB (metallophosphatase superfamily)